jgi:hypothetical protein
MRLGAHKIHTKRVGILGSWRGKLLVSGIALLLLAAPLSLFFAMHQAKAAPCECNIFGTPTGQGDFNDGAAVELGVKFIPSVNGTITGVRFYKQGAMSGTHTGRLWTSGGSQITSAVFTETASGWQNVTFSSPVSVTAGTTYVASVTMNDGRYVATSPYFTSDIVNGPLTAPSSASSGGNGVFTSTAGGFPTSSFNSANYWIDVSFFSTDVPTVQSVAPTDASTGVLPGKIVTATFDQSMSAASITGSTFTVKDDSNNAVAGSVSYNASTKTASFVPTEGYSTNKHYTVTLKGGSSGIKNSADIALASDYTWSFTTAATNSCPCSLKDRVNPTGTAAFDDTGGSELGVKVKASTSGYISALRFYKPIISTETTHTGHIWDASGNSLATVTFSNESEYGWQEAKLSSPLHVNENQVYVLSYTTTTATYVSSIGALTGTNISGGYLTAYADQSSENTATGSTTRNGVFSTTPGAYPGTGSTNGSYYWIDAVFSTTSNPDRPLTLGVTQPTANSYGIPRDQVVTAKFNRALDGATVTSSTFRVFNSSGIQVSGTATYDAAKGVASFTPSSQFSYGQRYTAKIAGTVADADGISLGSEYTWSFTVGSAVTTDPNAAPGGPILAITNASDPYSKYYAEILRTEGFNYFDTKDLGTVDAATLANYKTVVLAETSLTQAQADMLSAWVNAGGNLVAMRPDAKLAGLLGLTSAGTTRANQYMLIDTASAAGQGLVNQTIQFKGTADNYSLSGATALSTFYSDASTTTTNPAVTTKQVGGNGGTAVAFAYDLAKSVIAQHQGNKAWAGQNRDSIGPVRANDMFFGAKSGDIQPDWVDLNKLHIPQADEQQRLLANIIIESTKDKQPMPRFWYLPGDYKAAVIIAGDDHGLNNQSGTEYTMNNWLNDSPTNCSVMDWQCVRASHYVYESASLTNARAAQYLTYGFEIGDHVGTTCNDFSSFANLAAEYTSTLTSWRAKYFSLPNQISHRYHCYVWSDWDSQAKVDVANGIRYDLNYVAFPQGWIGTRAPIMTGSNMNMRFTDTTGAMLDVRQGTTNIDDQAAGETADTINALLDDALNNNYYGIFGTHYDMSNVFDKTLFSAISVRGVPMISSAQALAWLDGRNSSTFSNFSGSNGQYSFDVTAAVGANKLRAMLPTHDAGGTLTTLTSAGNAVTYQTQTVKGEEYAVFDAQPGNYVAKYSDYTSGGGDSGGTSGNGGSSGSSDVGQGAGSAQATPRVSRVTTPSQEASVLDEQKPAESPETTPSNTTKPTPTLSSNDGADTLGTAENTFQWWMVWSGLGALLAGFGFWLFLLWRRRHAESSGVSF